MVDGGLGSGGGTAPTAIKGEFYVEGYGSRMKLAEAPLQALSPKTKAQLSQLLNGIKILPSEEGYLRDWRGLAHCAKLKSEIVTFLADRTDPTRELLEHWTKQANACKLSDLQKFLGQIDRWDVIDDTNESFLNDAEQYVDLVEKRRLMGGASSTSDDQVPLRDEKENAHAEHEEKILTEDDVKLAQRGLPPQQYHAFVLYADEDVEFATELIERMESAGLKLCEKSRDLLGGTISHDAILRLIRERCNRLIVIVSPAFLKSRANTFFMNYAQALGIEQRRRKIVPCIYKKCILPPQLNFYFSLHYENRGKLFNFWDKLQQSIQSPDNYSSATHTSSVGVVSPKITITEINSVSQVEAVREAGPLMFPPPPKLRAGSSMFDLTAIEDDPQRASPSSVKQSGIKKSPSSLLSRFKLGDKDKSKSFWDLSSTKSPKKLSLADNSSASAVDFLTPECAMDSITSTTSASNLSGPESKSKKLKWYKKIMPLKAREGKKSNDGDLTPTSSRSFSGELYLGPPVEDSPIGEEDVKQMKKKKKKKLLGW